MIWVDWIAGLPTMAVSRRLLHHPEPRRPAVRPCARHPHALDGDGDGRCGDHSRRRRVAGRLLIQARVPQPALLRAL